MLQSAKIQRFLNKNNTLFSKHLNNNELEKFEEMYETKAYIPILKKALFKFEIKVLIILLPRLLSKKFFYKRFFNFFLKKLA